MTPEERLHQARESPVPYEERYVVLIDILGWSEIIKRSVSDPNAMSPIAHAAELIAQTRNWADNTNRLAGKSVNTDIRVSYFSDTFVLSLPVGTEVADTAEGTLNDMVGEICATLLESGHYTRGAIVRGLVRHTSNVLYGPSVVEAHELESRVAKYPRILVSPEAEAAFNDKTSLRTDFDGLKHLDYLRPYKCTDPELFKLLEHIIRRYKPLDEQVVWLEGIRNMVDRRAKDNARHLGIVAKDMWFLGYVDETLNRARYEAAG